MWIHLTFLDSPKYIASKPDFRERSLIEFLEPTSATEKHISHLRLVHPQQHREGWLHTGVLNKWNQEHHSQTNVPAPSNPSHGCKCNSHMNQSYYYPIFILYSKLWECLHRYKESHPTNPHMFLTVPMRKSQFTHEDTPLTSSCEHIRLLDLPSWKQLWKWHITCVC